MCFVADQLWFTTRMREEDRPDDKHVAALKQGDFTCVWLN